MTTLRDRFYDFFEVVFDPNEEAWLWLQARAPTTPGALGVLREVGRHVLPAAGASTYDVVDFYKTEYQAAVDAGALYPSTNVGGMTEWLYGNRAFIGGRIAALKTMRGLAKDLDEKDTDPGVGPHVQQIEMPHLDLPERRSTKCYACGRAGAEAPRPVRHCPDGACVYPALPPPMRLSGAKATVGMLDPVTGEVTKIGTFKGVSYGASVGPVKMKKMAHGLVQAELRVRPGDYDWPLRGIFDTEYRGGIDWGRAEKDAVVDLEITPDGTLKVTRG